MTSAWACLWWGNNLHRVSHSTLFSSENERSTEAVPRGRSSSILAAADNAGNITCFSADKAKSVSFSCACSSPGIVLVYTIRQRCLLLIYRPVTFSNCWKSEAVAEHQAGWHHLRNEVPCCQWQLLDTSCIHFSAPELTSHCPAQSWPLHLLLTSLLLLSFFSMSSKFTSFKSEMTAKARFILSVILLFCWLQWATQTCKCMVPKLYSATAE